MYTKKNKDFQDGETGKGSKPEKAARGWQVWRNEGRNMAWKK